MEVEMGLSWRRVTGSAVSIADQTKQDELHKLNLERLAIMLAGIDGPPLQLKYLMGADEFGMHLFPHGELVRCGSLCLMRSLHISNLSIHEAALLLSNAFTDNYKWEEKGAQHVKTSLKEDKRQYTGDICVNALGQVVAVHQIFAGKGQRSLPSASVMDKYPNFKFSVTSNHWANHESKVAYVQHIWKWVVEETARDNAANKTSLAPQAVLMLDCWPVNLTKEFRDVIKQSCPGLVLMFVPAGATGRYQVRHDVSQVATMFHRRSVHTRYLGLQFLFKFLWALWAYLQVNDTHFHKPLKSSHRTTAHEWFVERVVRLRRQLRLALATRVAADVPAVPIPPLQPPDAEPPGPAVGVVQPALDAVLPVAAVGVVQPALEAALPVAADLSAARAADPPAEPEQAGPQHDFRTRMRDLMSMQMLRNMAPKWLASACESLSEPIPGEGRNILKKGWDQIYLEPISAPGMYQCFPRAVSKSLQENS
jgi:hypothetical protein